MSIYKKFCSEIFGQNGELEKFTLQYEDDFNFGYDVVDAIADETPDKRAIVWCNTENEEHIFTFGDIKRLSNKAANVFMSQGIKKGDRVMAILKRHYEYWIVAVALHKMGCGASFRLRIAYGGRYSLPHRECGYKNGIVCTTQEKFRKK